MTQGQTAPWSGTPVPDPLIIARAADDLTEAMDALGIAGRAMAAEQRRLQGDGTADRMAVLSAWRASMTLLARAISRTETVAAALNRQAIDAAKLLGRIDPNSDI